jgi:predicted ATPase
VLTFPGHRILAQIYESSNSLVYRAVRELDNQPIILKLLKPDYPTSSELIRYKQEYEITRSLQLEGVVKAYNLQKYQNSLVMFLEDFGGESLEILFGLRNFTLSEILSLAIQITKALGEIHTANIIHKDINPANIVFNPHTGQVKIIDFGISTVFIRENPTIKNPNLLEGTLAYVSPEQTGRMNRALDYRTDFYSLGATLYKLLTQRLPFESTDALELVHCHIAKQPTPPHQLAQNIPQMVSNLVMKLLAKTAEERYQSALGIKVDLEECLMQLQTTNAIADFPLAHQDISGNFQIPQRLYGREQEIQTLMTAFERVAMGRNFNQFKNEMILVIGHAGIGKSALVQEIYKPITQRRGYFISGKFDQFQHNIPYLAVVQAFRSLVQQLLSESEVQLAQWREKLLTALGVNGQMIVDVIPEVELIIGPQPIIQPAEPMENQKRFNLVFQNFVRVFCQPSHPLVIFLDDLQWADSASLKLIELIMSDDEIQYLFLIGAYRDNEVHPLHPLIITVETLKNEGVIITQIVLDALTLNEITHLTADTLSQSDSAVRPLAELIMEKTQGNPFFVNEFLKGLYQDDLLVFDWWQGGWQWDIRKIKEKDITDNVVDLMIDRLKKLPESTQQILHVSACVGSSFDLNTLSIINEKLPTEIFLELLPGINQGLILPITALEVVGSEVIDSPLLTLNYKFLHDRVQQAACALIDTQQKKRVHLQIGRLLLKNASVEQKLEKIFDLVSHLNQAQDLIECNSEKLELIRLNLEAGKRAKDATAYSLAREYLIIGRDLLEENDHQRNYELFFYLHKELAEVEYLNGNFEQAEALINLALEGTTSAIKKVELYRILILMYGTTAQYEEAIAAGKKCLALLDIELPESNIAIATQREINQIDERLKGRKIASLIDIPEMTSPIQKAAFKILGAMDSSAYMFDTIFFALLITKQVNLCLQHGNLPEAAKFYSDYGIVLIYTLENYQAAYEFGLFALNLSEKFKNHSQKCRVCLTLSWLSFWVKPLEPIDTILEDGYKSGIESGEILFAGYTLAYILFMQFHRGIQLEKIFDKSLDFIQFCKINKIYLAIELILTLQLIILNLIEIPKDKLISANEISESQYLAKDHFPHVVCIYQTLKAQVLYIFNQPEEALKCILKAENLMTWIVSQHFVSEHNFYWSLILATLYPQASEEKQKQYWERLEANQKKMKVWADNCPENFLHKYLLVAAEMARISGRLQEAMNQYDQAIDIAREHEFVQDEALANELAAKFWLEQGKEAFVQLYLKRACQGYQIWGAKRKVEDLDERYSQWLTSISPKIQNNFINTSIEVSNNTNAVGSIDLATVIKASQMISSEIALDKLLEKLMKVVIENAGAQKGFLLLPSKESSQNIDSKWVIEAEGTVDKDDVSILQSIPVNSAQPPLLSIAIINYVGTPLL